MNRATCPERMLPQSASALFAGWSRRHQPLPLVRLPQPTPSPRPPLTMEAKPSAIVSELVLHPSRDTLRRRETAANLRILQVLPVSTPVTCSRRPGEKLTPKGPEPLSIAPSGVGSSQGVKKPKPDQDQTLSFSAHFGPAKPRFASQLLRLGRCSPHGRSGHRLTSPGTQQSRVRRSRPYSMACSTRGRQGPTAHEEVCTQQGTTRKTGLRGTRRAPESRSTRTQTSR
jgi:hypothetical protein